MNRRRILAIAAGALALPALPRQAAAAETLRFEEFYSGGGILGLTLSEKLKGLDGKPVEIAGFMAPPLKAGADFFVLTKEPVSLCPFCNSDADWPSDIVVVFLKEKDAFRQENRAIAVTGRLEVGSKMDPRTGFVSLVRLVDARVRGLG